jgi:hypothetical protein
MKKALNYPELWQQKRNKLPVDGDPNAGWLEMQAILDSVMPVTAVIKKPYSPKGIKGLHKLLIGFSTAALIYGAVQLYLSRQHNDQRIAPQKTIRFAPAPLIKDSTAVTPLPNDQPVIKPVVVTPPNMFRKKPLQDSKQADSVERPPTPNADDIIVHRDSVLIPVNPGLLRTDSAVKTLPAGLNINPNRNTAPGNAKPIKKKRRKFQIGV